MQIVRFVGDSRCTDQAYREAIADEERAVFDVVSSDRNAILNFTMGASPIRVPLSRTARDLVELALSIYVADTFLRRNDQPDRWTRQFDFLFPITDPDLWRTVETTLVETLEALSGDHFSFSFPQTRPLPAWPMRRQRLPRGFDAVCLFSGGFDSLLGAHALLSEGKIVLLVGHQAVGVTSSSQKRLAEGLRRVFPGSFAFVQCRGGVSKIRCPRFAHYAVLERTYRMRSFLFLALGVAFATAIGAPALYIPENGLIALNPPLGLSRIGSLSTRTAHPRFLWQFRKLAETLGLFKGEFKNPFMFQSKTDLAEALAPELQQLVLESVSCSNVNLRLLGARADQRHCGHCIPCLYRRFALAAAGLDDPSHYVKDAFRRLGTLSSYMQANLRMLVAFAARVARMHDAQLQGLVIAHGWFPPQVGGIIGPVPTEDYQPWANMLARWAKKTLEQVDELCLMNVKHYSRPTTGAIGKVKYYFRKIFKT